MIVEDDLVSAEYLKAILENAGFQIIGIVSGGAEAIEALRGCNVDLVLMDIILKDSVTGIEAALKHPECRFIFLTAYADDEMVESAVDVRAVAYLMKPYREKEIVATVRMALAQRETKHTAQQPSSVVLSHGYAFDFRHDRLEKDGQTVPLPATMLKLVRFLSLHHDEVVSPEALSAAIWDAPKRNSTLRSLINRFRSSVDRELIVSVSGVGYTIRSASLRQNKADRD